MSASQSVLVVDGDYDNCDTVTASLTARGYAVHDASDAATARELVERHEYAVAVLYHWPPYLDALGLFRRVQHVRPALPVVIVAPGDVVAPPAESGRARVVVPPAGLEHVLATVDELTARAEQAA